MASNYPLTPEGAKILQLAEGLGPSSGAYKPSKVQISISNLENKGVVFDLGPYAVKAAYESKVYTQTTTQPIKLLLAGNVSAAALVANQGLTQSWLDQVSEIILMDAPVDKVLGLKTMVFNAGKAVTMITPVEIPEHPMMKPKVGAAFAAAPSMVKETKPKTVDTSKLVKLRDATKIGQAVRGTNSTSIYNVIAMNDGVKVAVRRDAAKFSVRIECTPSATQEEEEALSNNTYLTPSSEGHRSVHFSVTCAAQAKRAVGALLFDLGITFKQLGLGQKEFFGDD